MIRITRNNIYNCEDAEKQATTSDLKGALTHWQAH